MMKIVIFLGAFLVLCSSSYVDAAGVFTPSEKSIFKNFAKITYEPIVVPRIIEVDAPFDISSPQIHAVIDAETQQPVPSIIIDEVAVHPVQFDVTGSENIRLPQAIADHNSQTYAEFMFSETLDKNGYVIPDEATIDLIANRPITTAGFSLLLGAHSSAPQSIRVSVIENEEERLLLPYKNVYQSTVSFPQITSAHFRISMKYKDVMRIHEIVFSEISAPMTQIRRIRFLAQPEHTYQIFYNADHYIAIDAGERPRLHEEEQPLRGKITATENPDYHQADTDGDGIIDYQDNCPVIPNPQQTDKNKNNKGDACEDFDHDGILGGNDNCPNIPNYNQRDQDADGIGDACDDREDRFLERYTWLPTLTIIIVGLFATVLIVLTLKKK